MKPQRRFVTPHVALSFKLFKSRFTPLEIENALVALRIYQRQLNIMVQLPQIEVNLEQTTEIAGQLAAPLQLNGQTIPTGAMVQLSIIPTEDDNAYLMANTIVLPNNGAAIAISARGSVITGETITEKRGAEVGKENAAIGSYIGQSIVLAAGGDAEEAIQGGSALGTVGGIIGLVSPANRKVVRLVQGIYFLDLE
ncbi:MAG: hypothetical protein AAGE84_27415 [Cyanobacteria bacterium P01_G01_bin.39]